MRSYKPRFVPAEVVADADAPDIRLDRAFYEHVRGQPTRASLRCAAHCDI